MHASSRRGFTLLELMVAMGITAILVTMAVQGAIMVDRGRRPRELLAQIQGEGRQGLGYLEADLRAGSLGAGTGIIRTAIGGNPASRPAVQIFENVGGGGFLDVKPGTDAVLVVRSAPSDGVRPALVGDVTTTTGALIVTDVGPFTAGAPVLAGEYEDAVWIPISTIDVDTKTLTSSLGADVFPGKNAHKINAGALVRPARARLYYVDAQDRLVRADLAVPRPPETAADVTERVDIARNVENLQVDCSVEQGLALTACPAAIVGQDVTTEAVPALGEFPAGGGARLQAASGNNDVAALRTVSLSVVVRSRELLGDPGPTDPRIQIQGVTLAPSGTGVNPNGLYMRRSYQLGVAVRNTSLGSL
ncbi:prepilin-type N-terminal cleavage/methylation domain-containing protein [Anaeromyxobacter sp. Red801]|uniref:prepilin-type N-terminal cleavage/methylation domain-containing protein n=1 Tax=Anaeromyxobacter sp. Red801 TaxID=3411632 RepID=UPI003B9EC9C7